METYQEEYERILGEYNVLEKQLTSGNNEKNDVYVQILKTQKRIDFLKPHVEEAAKRISELTDLRNDITVGRSRLDTMSSIISRYADVKDIPQEEIDSIRKNLYGITHQGIYKNLDREKIYEQVEAFKEQYRQKEEKFHTLYAQYEEFEDNFRKKDLANSKSKQNGKDSSLDEKAEKQKLDEEASQKRKEEKEKLEKEKKEIEEKIKGLQDEVKKLHDMIKSGKFSKEDIKRFKQNIKRLLSDIQELKARLLEIGKEIDDLNQDDKVDEGKTQGHKSNQDDDKKQDQKSNQDDGKAQKDGKKQDKADGKKRNDGASTPGTSVGGGTSVATPVTPTSNAGTVAKTSSADASKATLRG